MGSDAVRNMLCSMIQKYYNYFQFGKYVADQRITYLMYYPLIRLPINGWWGAVTKLVVSLAVDICYFDQLI